MKKLIAEFIGTYFLVLTIGMVVNGPAATDLAPIAIGAVLMVMIYAGGHISGAHYNPAVTLAFLLLRKISTQEALLYMLVQIVSALAAAGTVIYLLGPAAMPAQVNLNPDLVGAILAELIGTFALVYVVLNVALADANAGKSFYGLAIGLTVTAMAYALGQFSGGAFNPAVAMGISLMKLVAWADIWIYLTACSAGAILAALLYGFLSKPVKPVQP